MTAAQATSPGLTIKEFCALNNCSRSTVYRGIWEGKIRAYKVRGGWRIREDDAAALQQPLARGSLDTEIRRLVDAAPKLSPAQRDALAAIFAEPGGGADDPP